MERDKIFKVLDLFLDELFACSVLEEEAVIKKLIREIAKVDVDEYVEELRDFGYDEDIVRIFFTWIKRKVAEIGGGEKDGRGD